MDINSILKTGGSVDILIRSYSGQVIAGKSYGKNEPYTVLNNVNINFYTSQEGAGTGSNGNLLYYNDAQPSIITLMNVPLSEKVIDLIFLKNNKALKSHYFIAEADEHTLIMQHNHVKNVFIYELETNNYIGFAEEVDDKIIQDDNLINGNKYIVFYEYEDLNSKKQFNLVSPSNNYFTLDIFGKGNTNNNTADIFFKFKKCVLKTDTTLTFNEGLNTVNLSFKIIKDDRINENNYFIVD